MGTEISSLTKNKTSFLLAIIQTESQFKKTANIEKECTRLYAIDETYRCMAG